MGYKYFNNKSCEYYPCHNLKEVNCLFCYCPLYNFLNCGGKPIILKNGVKDCSECNMPHTKKGWDFVNKYINGKGNL
jgi:Zn-finger protein